jgi:hypothetical protein
LIATWQSSALPPLSMIEPASGGDAGASSLTAAAAPKQELAVRSMPGCANLGIAWDEVISDGNLQDREQMERSIDPRRVTLRGTQWCLRHRFAVWNSRRGNHLGSGRARPHQQAGHMDASDPIEKSAHQGLASRGPSTYGSRAPFRSAAPRCTAPGKGSSPMLAPMRESGDPEFPSVLVVLDSRFRGNERRWTSRSASSSGTFSRKREKEERA